MSVKTSGLLQLAAESQQTVQFTQPEDKVIYFKLKASEALGAAKVVVTATSGSLKATYDVEMEVRASNPAFIAVADKLLSSQEKWVADYEPLGIAGTNEGVLEVSTLPSLNLEQRLQYLIQYPHGCIEQTTSAAFPQLYLASLTKLDESRKSLIERNIVQAINTLRGFQLPSGGFTYWPGNDVPDAWGTNYAGHFLLEAKQKRLSGS